jgi:hypothetical protein
MKLTIYQHLSLIMPDQILLVSGIKRRVHARIQLFLFPAVSSRGVLGHILQWHSLRASEVSYCWMWMFSGYWTCGRNQLSVEYFTGIANYSFSFILATRGIHYLLFKFNLLVILIVFLVGKVCMQCILYDQDLVSVLLLAPFTVYSEKWQCIVREGYCLSLPY